MNLVYSVVILICVLSMLTMSIHVKGSLTLTKQAKIWFVVTFMGIALGATAECIIGGNGI